MRSQLFRSVSRLVVKFGTGILTDSARQLDPARVKRLVDQVATLVASGKEVVLVSSGAVGAGMGVLGLSRRPTELAELQACAAVGQTHLMATYAQLFRAHRLQVGQILLTHEDLRDHDRHLNARNTLVSLLAQRVVPIINENDTVSFTELKFGDNDRLSALVATLLPADLLIILTSVDGLIENYGRAGARRITRVEAIDPHLEKLAKGTASTTSIGGMSTKLQAARIVMRAGIPMVIASGLQPDTLSRILAGEDEGTLFVPRPEKLKGRKRWIAFFHHPRGALIVDAGAKQALREGHKSLLQPGIVRCEGSFQAGEVVRICDLDGTEFARGIVRFDAAALAGKLPRGTEIVHRNHLVIL